MLDGITNFVTEHQGSFSVAAVWFAHSFKDIRQWAITIYTDVVSCGGIWRLFGAFFSGVPAAPAKPIKISPLDYLKNL